MRTWRFLVLALFCLREAYGQNWIWHPQTNAPTVYFRKTFRTPPLTWNAKLTLSADDRAEVFLNGVSVGRCLDPQSPLRGEVSVRLNQGENVIAVRAENRSGPGGLLTLLNLNGQTNVISDGSWLSSTNEEANWSSLAFNAAHWQNATVIAAQGAAPWGEVLFRASATPAESLKVADGFKVELLRSAAADEGSWICMTFDDRGRLIISPQGDDRPLLRMELKEGKVASVEKMEAPIRYAMGLLYAFDGLYANAHGPQGAGLYRLSDLNKNDRFETNEVRLLKGFKGESEHGYHGLALGPDRSIYVLNGNGTKLPDNFSTNSPYANYGEDALSGSRGEEAQDGTKAPNCYVLKTDPEGKQWKLWAGGMRNAYDLDFNEDGELFTFDSDMEWDWGTPWYRPTRVLHLVSGGEYGWRDGTRMWADYYLDALPPVADIGIGSPTGVKFGTKSNFPEKYQRALFLLDWSYGRIFALHLSEQNSSYTGRPEIFLQGTPLNLTALAFGPDGAMYFITGGRGTQSGLYGVMAQRPEKRTSKKERNGAEAARQVRHQLEAMHGNTDAGSLEFINNQLYTANDRFIQFAARVALESRRVDDWKSNALLARNGLTAPEAMLLALARVGGPANALSVINRLLDLEFITPERLRIVEVILSRYGEPSPDVSKAIVHWLKGAYAAKDPKIVRERYRILLRLEAPGAVQRSMELLERGQTLEDQMFFVEQLRNVRSGWTPADRQKFFTWFLQPNDPQAHPPELLRFFREAGRKYVDGAWFDKYLRDFRRQAASKLSSSERNELLPLLSRPLTPAQSVPAQERNFVREWRISDLLADLEQPRKADFQRGRRALADAQCLSCHRFGNDGGTVGPELTGAGGKYSPRDILESILEPSKVLSDQYQNHTVLLQDGDSVSGRLISDSDRQVVVEIDRVNGVSERIPREKIADLRPSSISPMPEGLVNILSKEEILDLIAYIRSGVVQN